MALTFIPVPTLRAQIGCGHSTLYKRIAAGLWPPLVKLGRASRGVGEEYQTVMAAVVAGRSDDEIRRLVKRIVESRTLGIEQHAGT